MHLVSLVFDKFLHTIDNEETAMLVIIADVTCRVCTSYKIASQCVYDSKYLSLISILWSRLCTGVDITTNITQNNDS